MSKKSKIILILLSLILVGYFIFFSLPKVIKDFYNFDWNNQNEIKVLDSNYFSAYKGSFVLRIPIGRNAFSFGFIGLGNKNDDILTVKHEYGHYLQLKELGWYKYIKYIAIPSLNGYWSDDIGYYEYYSQPWEYGADLYGNVDRVNYPYVENVMENYINYMNMIK